MAIFNGNQVFKAKRAKTVPIAKIPNNVKKAFNISKAYTNGIFKIEPMKKEALYDKCYLFEDINYINKNVGEQRTFLLDLMTWLNSMNVDFKITLANEYQDMDEFLKSIRNEKNREIYPDVAQGMRQWQEQHADEANPNVTTLRYLTVTSRADTEEHAKVYLNALESVIEEAFEGWGSRIVKLDARERISSLQVLIRPGHPEEREYISFPEEGKGRRDWKNDVLPRSITQYKNFMIMGDTYLSVLFGCRYRKTINSDRFIKTLSSMSFPSFLTMDFAPVDNGIVTDKLNAMQMNADKEISEELEQKQKAGLPAIKASYAKEKKQRKINKYIDQVDENDEMGYFMNLLLVVTAPDEETLAERVREVQASGRKEGCILETADEQQLKAWNTALPFGGRQVDYMRFFLTASLVAFQPYHAQDIIEPGGQMLGFNKTTKRYIIGNRKKLPSPHAIIVGYSGTGKSMLIKNTELAQTLLGTDDDMLVLDPQNEFQDVITSYSGSYFDLTPRSGTYLNGFEISEEVLKASGEVKEKFIAKQAEYAKSLCGAAMKNIVVTQEHDSVISRCTKRMFDVVFEEKKVKRQPTLTWLREEIKKELDSADNDHDGELIRKIYNCLEEYTFGSCDLLGKPSNIEIDNRLVGFGLKNVPENNWEAVMVTILHYLSVRMDYNSKLQRATHLIIDESQIVSKKPGSAVQLNNAVITFRKFGGLVTMAMQNVTAALSNQLLTEMFANCSCKIFLDQGGTDAKSLAAIQEFSAKEFRALSSPKPGHGVLVWNGKIVLFDAEITKSNILYEKFSTNFHEGANWESKADEKLEKEKEREEGTRLSEAEKMVLKLAEMVPVDANDVAAMLKLPTEKCQDLLEQMHQKKLIEKEESGRYRKVA